MSNRGYSARIFAGNAGTAFDHHLHSVDDRDTGGSGLGVALAAGCRAVI